VGGGGVGVGGVGYCWGRMCYIACSLQQFAIVICATLGSELIRDCSGNEVDFFVPGWPLQLPG
jgi:hypothetical protein